VLDFEKFDWFESATHVYGSFILQFVPYNVATSQRLFPVLTLVCLDLVVRYDFVSDCEVYRQRHWVAVRYLEVLNSHDLLKNSQEFFTACSCNLVPTQVEACKCIVVLTDPVGDHFGAYVRNIVFPQIQFRDHVLILQEVAKFYHITVR